MCVCREMADGSGIGGVQNGQMAALWLLRLFCFALFALSFASLCFSPLRYPFLCCVALVVVVVVVCVIVVVSWWLACGQFGFCTHGAYE